MASLYAARVFRVNVLERIQLFSSRGPRGRSRALLDPAPNERAGRLILEEDVATFQPPRQQHSVGVLHEGEEGLARSAHLWIPRFGVIAHPLRGGGVEAEVPPEDHAAVVELEALRRVDAAHLVDAPGSDAQKLELRMPAASRPASGLAFHGIDQLPTSTSGTSWPAGVGSNQFRRTPPPTAR